MKTIKNIATLLLLIVVGIIHTGCKKDPVMYSKGLESFKLAEKDEAGTIVKEYPGTITDNEIIVPLPIGVDVTRLTVNFTTENPRTIVQVGGEVQESGVTEQDFTQPLPFKIKAEDRSTRTYHVKVEKKIAMETYGFFKEDNPKLEDDYIAVIRGKKIDIAVPESIDLTKLVARFQTTAGATLKIGSTTQQSRLTVNSFSNPVEYILENPALTEPFKLTVAISFMGPKWWMIGDKSIIVPSTAELKMAINPITRYPYLAYIRSGKDESGTTIPNENKKVAVIGFNGTVWRNLGASTGISDTRTADLDFAFNSEGTPYVSYEDYLDSKQKGTVLRYVNDTWTSVGDKNFTPMRVDKYSFTLGENDQPVVAATTFTAITGYAKRAIYVTNFSSGQWANITPLISNPLLGSLKVFKGLDGKTYLALIDRDNTLSMFKLTNNVWTAVGPTKFRAPDNLQPYTSVIGAASANGEVYIGYQTVVGAERLNRILKFNPTTVTWEELGSAGNSQGIDEQYALAIAPNGALYFAFANNSGLYARTFNNVTNNWNNPRLVVSGKTSVFDMQISSDGIPYVAVSTTSDGKTAVYKYTATK
jgi:hypothetical protein